MGGTRAGWEKAKAKMIERMGSEEAFHQSRVEMGEAGGRISRGSWLTNNHKGAVEMGRRGGSADRRGRSNQ